MILVDVSPASMMAKGLWESLCAHLVDADNNDDDAEKDDAHCQIWPENEDIQLSDSFPTVQNINQECLRMMYEMKRLLG